MSRTSLFISILLCGVVRGNHEHRDTQYTDSDLQDEDHFRSLVDEIKATLKHQDQVSFDALDASSLSEVRKILTDHGFNADDILVDKDFWSSITGIFSTSGGKRFTTMNFGYQLACYQGRGGTLLSKGLWAWRQFNGYGCYCGGGWYYGNYLDATDHCCKIHDACYERVQAKYNLENGCHTYTTPYTVYCCKEQKITKCTDSGPSAGRELCECDQAMAKCVAEPKASSTYNKSFYNNRSGCNDKAGKYKKSMGFWELLKTCKDYFKSRKTFPITYGSQGTCPAQKKKRGWWFGKKKDQ